MIDHPAAAKQTNNQQNQSNTNRNAVERYTIDGSDVNPRNEHGNETRKQKEKKHESQAIPGYRGMCVAHTV